MLKSWPLAKYAGRTKKKEYKDGSAAQVHIQRKTEENGGKAGGTGRVNSTKS